jgi:hypothetical protein
MSGRERLMLLVDRYAKGAPVQPDSGELPDQRLSHALNLMTRALVLLDRAGAPAPIGSSLDFAIAKLERRLGRDAHAGSVRSLIDQFEREL